MVGRASNCSAVLSVKVGDLHIPWEGGTRMTIMKDESGLMLFIGKCS